MRFLYLHGFASSPASRKAQALQAAFQKHSLTLEVPTLDQGDFAHLTISRQLQLLDSILVNQPATLIGSSMGGYLAAIYASLHPEITRLALLAPAFGFASHWRATTESATIEQWQQTGWRDIYHYGDRQVRPIHYGLLEDALAYPETPDFHQPALLFHGRNDAVVPIEFSQSFTATHPNAELIELASDHELTDVLELIIDRALPFLLAT